MYKPLRDIEYEHFIYGLTVEPDGVGELLYFYA
jgi:hypothetical protein